MHKSTIDRDFSFVTNDQSPEVADPCNGSFHFPATFVSPQRSTILSRRFTPVGFVRADQVNAALLETTAKRITVGGLVVNQTLRVLPRPSWPATRHRHVLQHRFDQCYFVRGRRGQLNSERNTLAACHHHPLRTLSAFGLSDAQTPFFAGAKLPSANVSSQFNCPCSSNSPRNARQIFSQTSCSSQSCRRRQHVLGEGYDSGKSFHRAPLRKTHKMPSKHRRFSMRRRPPLGEVFGLGNRGAILDHCSSVSSESVRAMKWIPFHGVLQPKCAQGASL